MVWLPVGGMALCAWLLSLLILVPSMAAAQQPPVRMLFINPADPEDKYWSLVTDVMRAAAKDLNVELEVQHAFHSGEYTLKYVSLATQSAQKPRYIIFRNVERVAVEVFAMTRQAGIDVITIDTPLENEELSQIGGGPRRGAPSWIGQVVPNAFAAADKMASLLAQEINRRGFRGVMQAVVMSGPESDVGSLIRIAGIKKGLKDAGNAQVLGTFPGNWSTRVADREAYKAFRYAAKAPIWLSVDDNMMLGVINVLRNTHRTLGQDTFSGAFHWTEPMMTAILQNKVQYVAGGHFIQGAAALILAHDHARGKDFAEVGVNHTMELSFIYRKNVAQVGRIVIAGAWDRIDFRRFSRATNPALAQYDWAVNSYLRAVLGQ